MWLSVLLLLLLTVLLCWALHIHLKFSTVSMKRGRKSFTHSFIWLVFVQLLSSVGSCSTNASDWKAIHHYSLVKFQFKPNIDKMLSFLISFSLIESWGQMSHRQSKASRWSARAYTATLNGVISSNFNTIAVKLCGWYFSAIILCCFDKTNNNKWVFNWQYHKWKIIIKYRKNWLCTKRVEQSIQKRKRFCRTQTNRYLKK